MSKAPSPGPPAGVITTTQQVDSTWLAQLRSEYLMYADEAVRLRARVAELEAADRPCPVCGTVPT